MSIPDPLTDRLRDQGGLITRRQIEGRGLKPHDLERLVRRRDLALVHPGVYVDHTGPLTWLQRAWAAVLYAGPRAALSHSSALRAADGPGRRERPEEVIEVAVDRGRRLAPIPGVRFRRTVDLDHRVQWSLAPPRIRYDEAILDLAADAESELAAVGVLADACGARRTTASRLLRVARARRRLRRRSWITGVLTDIAEGTCSVLEHGYLDRVERPHGLPSGHRQVGDRTGARTAYRDVEYVDHGVIVELDGRLFHDSAQARDRDLERDLDTAILGRRTLRLGFGQVFDRPCDTAAKVAQALHGHGWAGQPARCPACPTEATVDRTGEPGNRSPAPAGHTV